MINEILLKKAINGDKESFYKLIDPIKDNLYKIAFTYVENEHDALDCVHDSILKAIKSLHTLKEPQYFNTWITRITINTCKDIIKKNNKIKLVDINDYENILTINENKSDDNIEIELSINKLTSKEKDLIIMRYLEDKSLKDISHKYEIPLGTVKSKINRTLKKLRDIIGEI
ncbi:sigma-70 family RNA polymerase sigma factor [Clostridium sp.]|uniref:sigma-70 family RNA polymerase sigma factor n=1 Tax=Clostridium sp. TaxID=1506 RepID=UPI0025B9BACF|nr:sigma-70 family RNA polymerase sigma factor [Clostridium sp.]MCI9070586.1 sigma-70 family RNA polymerase sigma factor [Clostridium sp.]